MNTQQKVLTAAGAAAVCLGLYALYRRYSTSNDEEDSDSDEETTKAVKHVEVDEENESRAKQLKDEGNAAFKNGEFDAAIQYYTDALALSPIDEHLYYSNRSAAFLSKKDFLNAVKDAEKCIELKPKWGKGYFRLGKAYREQSKYDDAFMTFVKGLENEPNSDELKNLIDVTRRSLDTSPLDSVSQLEKHLLHKYLSQLSEATCKTLSADYPTIKSLVLHAEKSQEGFNLLDNSTIAQLHSTNAVATLKLLVQILLAAEASESADFYAQKAKEIAPHDPEVLYLWIQTTLDKERQSMGAIVPAQFFYLLDAATEAINLKKDEPLIAHLLAFIITRMTVNNQQLSINDTLKTLSLAFECPGANKLLIADAGVRLWFKLFEDPEIGQKLQMDNLSQPPDDSQIIRSLIKGGFHDLMIVQFFLDSLSTVTFNNPAVESFLAPVVRKALLSLGTDKTGLENFNFLQDLIYAVALQCYRNSYAWPYSADEKRKLTQLIDATKKMLEQPDTALDGDGIESTLNKKLQHHLALISLYRPLNIFDNLKQVIDKVDNASLHKWFSLIVKKSLYGPIEEANLATDIKTLTNVADNAEGRRRLQIWDNAGMHGGKLTKITLPEELQIVYRHTPSSTLLSNNNNNKQQVLIFGCGSGLEIYQTFVVYDNVEISGVDPSLANLAFSKRQNNELGATNINLYVADLLQLQPTHFPNLFDFIIANQTLSMLSDPVRALEIVGSLLKPGGIAKITVFSMKYLEAVATIRKYLASKMPNGSSLFSVKKGQELPTVLKQPTDDDARKAREILFTSEDETVQNAILVYPSFYSLHEFMDMIFHPQLVGFSFSDIGGCVEEAGLKFVSFDFPQVPQEVILAYTAKTGDTTFKNFEALDRYEAAEAEQPSFGGFSNLYLTTTFIVEKTG